MNIFFIVLGILTFSNICNAGFSFSNKTSAIKVMGNSTFQIDTPITGWNGTLTIDSGGTVAGSSIQFQEGALSDTTSESGVVEGTFERNFDSISVDNVLLNGDKSIHINGEVRGTVLIEGMNNKISGSPRFTRPITLSDTITSHLTLGIVSDCDVNIALNSGALSLDNKLEMAPGTSITSVGGTGIINLNDNTLGIGGVTNGWIDDFTFPTAGTIQLSSDLNLKSTWLFQSDTTINGQGNSLDITDASAKIIISPGVTLCLSDVTLNGLKTLKVIFQANDSALKLSNANITLTGNFSQTTGQFIVYGESKINMGATPFQWIQSAGAIFINNASTLWLDTGNNDVPAVFGFMSTANVLSSYVDNNVIKQVVDFDRVRDAVIRYLVSGSVNQNTTIESSFFVQPEEAIVFTGNSTVAASGINISFANTTDPQFVIETGNNVTFAGNQTLSVYSNTIQIEEGATLGIDGDTSIVLNSDVSLPTGNIKIKNPGGSLNISGSGGTKRFGLSAVPGLVPATFDIGYGEMVISNADFYGLDRVKKSRSMVNGVLKEGCIVLDGNARIHVQNNTDMNFRVRGSENSLIIEKNNVKFTGKINFDEVGDNVLHIRFELDAEEDQLGFAIGKDTMNLFSSTGIARLIIDDFDVLIENLDPDSFIVGGHSFINGQFIRIKSNPIKQGSSDLSLGRDLVFLKEGDLFVPIQIIANSASLSLRRGASFASAFKFPNLPEFEHYFRNRSLTRAPRRPNLRIPGVIDSRTTRDVVRIQKNGQITNFGSDPFAPLELQLSGGARVQPPVRRRKKTVKPVRGLSIPDFKDTEYTDSIKKTDAIYVSGVDNKIIVTGNFEVSGKIVMDEGSELIFQFDDSVDTPKAIKISTILDDGSKGLYLPKSSSIIFSGAGQVIFDDKYKLEFYGDDPIPVSISGNNQSFEDNRPTLIFKDYAELAIDLDEKIEFFGKGQILLQNNASARISVGQLLIGTDTEDNFNITTDRMASIKLGTIGSDLTASPDRAAARFSLGEGDFAVKFDRGSILQINNDGVFEVALNRGVYQNGHVSEFLFNDKSTLEIEEGGRLALAQISMSDLGSTDSNFSWNNVDGVVKGNGMVAFYSQAYSTPIFEGSVQSNQFKLSGSSSLAICKELVRKTKSGLIKAADFTDIDGQYQIILRNNVVVDLNSTDTIRREDPTLGTVFGTDAAGIRFAILTTGERQSLTAAI